jgi:hypothetical protein
MFVVGGETKSAYALCGSDPDSWPDGCIYAVYEVDLQDPELYDSDGEGCQQASINTIDDGEIISSEIDETTTFCIVISEDVDTVNIQARADEGDGGDGEFRNAVCGDEDGDSNYFEHLLGSAPVSWDDLCEDQDGNGTADLTVYCGDGAESECGEVLLTGTPPSTVVDAVDGGILVHYVCPDEAAFVEITITNDNDEHVFFIDCFAQPDTIEVTAKPTTVEIVPQIGSFAHSEITIVLSGDGLPVDADDLEIDVSVPKCAIEIGLDDPDTSPLTDNWPADDDISVSFPTTGPNADKTVIDNIWFHADWNNCTPGDVVVTVNVEVDDGADLVDTVTIKVVGPPAFITATAAPDRLICGEKSTITVKVTDAIGQNVSNNTQVELISNWGSVIAGTGATLGFPGTGPVNPLASSAAATYNGVAVAYLLTSNNHVGAYEVVAAAGGTLAFPSPFAPAGDINDPYYNEGDAGTIHDHNDSLYTGAPITTQVTVTCSLPAAPVAPTVTAPQTGTGSITPPNTGDAGLASSSSNAMLFVIVGAAAFVLAGIASVSYARR